MATRFMISVGLLVATGSVAACAGRSNPTGGTFVVAQVRDAQSECSGLGGEHATLRVDGDGRLIYAGGHADYLGLAGTSGLGGFERGWYVVEIVAEHIRAQENAGGGWCLHDMPAHTARALRLVRAPDRNAARKILKQLEETGLPRQTWTYVAEGRGPETFALARLVSVTSVDGTQAPGREPDLRYQLDILRGEAPAQLDVPGPARAFGHVAAFPGDYLVVAAAQVAGAPRITRVLVTDGAADGRRWLDAVKKLGWPPATVTSRAADEPLNRWIVEGPVVEGAAGCGLEIAVEKDVGEASTDDDRTRVPAPPGAHQGDYVIAVEAAWHQPDRCGRKARALRGYRVPPRNGDNSSDRYDVYDLHDGEPPPTRPFFD